MAKAKDIISEADFNRKTIPNRASPEEDSPGDSEADSMSEIEMGFDYSGEESENEEDIPAFEKGADDEREKFTHANPVSEDDIPPTSKGISSELPAPRLDRDKSSSTH